MNRYVILLVWWMLLLGNASRAQEELPHVNELLSSYREEISIHLDGAVYLTGDYLRFSLLCLDASNKLISPLSRIAYVELLNDASEPLARCIVELKEGKGHGDLLLPFTLSSGNYILRAYTRWMRNFAAAGYSHTEVSIVNPFKPLGTQPGAATGAGEAKPGIRPDNDLAFTASKAVYANREKVELNLRLNGELQHALLSVSVSKVPDFFQTPAPARAAGITHQQSTHVYLPETRGQLVTGKVTDSETGEPRAGHLVYLAVTGKLPGFYVSKSDGEGSVRFEVLDFYGPGEIHLQSAGPEAVVKVDLESPFSNDYAAIAPSRLVINESWEKYLTTASQNMQIRSVYADTLPAFTSRQVADTLPFYGLPDQRYYLDDYTRFPLTEEVLREYVAGIMLRKRDKGFYFKMVDVENKAIMEEDPLILYDGLPIADASKIVEIDPRLIKRIDVLTRKFYMGDAVFHGVTSFHTYDGDLKGLDKQLVGKSLPFEGLQLPHMYLSRQYENENQKTSVLPDFRTTLYWNPALSVQNGDALVEFYTGDDTGTYLISINGISEGGRLVSAQSVIRVESE